MDGKIWKYPTTKETWPKYDASCNYPAVTCFPGKDEGASRPKIREALLPALTPKLCFVKALFSLSQKKTVRDFLHDIVRTC